MWRSMLPREAKSASSMRETRFSNILNPKTEPQHPPWNVVVTKRPLEDVRYIESNPVPVCILTKSFPPRS